MIGARSAELQQRALGRARLHREATRRTATAGRVGRLAAGGAALTVTMLLATMLCGGVAVAAAAAPVVAGVAPANGLTSGGETVKVYGQGFVTGATTVQVGGAAATSVSVISPYELTAVTPAGTAGAPVNVTATTSAGTSTTTNVDLFQYRLATPAVHANAVGPTSVALSWTAPAGPYNGVLYYTVERSTNGGTPVALCTVGHVATSTGCSVGAGGAVESTDGYTTSFLDNSTSLTASTNYSYTVIAQTAAAGAQASTALPVSTPSTSTEVDIAGPGCPTFQLQSNTAYVLTGNLSTTSGTCLTPAPNATNVVVECKSGGTDHSISTSDTSNPEMNLNNASGFLIEDCDFSASWPAGTQEPQLVDNGGSNVTIENDQFTAAPNSGGLNLYNGSGFDVVDNTATDSETYQQGDTNDNFVGNTITLSSSSNADSEPLDAVNGWGGVEADNVVNGGSASAGADDDMYLESEGAYVLADNTLSNDYDCGIEANSEISDTAFVGNTISSSGNSAICGFGQHGASWSADTVSGNDVSHVQETFIVDAINPVGDGVPLTVIDDIDDSFTNNVGSSLAPTGANTSTSAFNIVPGDTTPVEGGGNVIAGNTFDTSQPPPIVSTQLGVTSANNVCREPSSTANPPWLACPSIAGVTPTTWTGGSTKITVTGTGFSAYGTPSLFAGGIQATGLSVASDTSLSATAPSGTSGISAGVSVQVPGVSGTSAPATASLPVVTGVSPSTGGIAGGTTVTVSGSGLTGANQVDFVTPAGSSTPAAWFAVNSDGSITAVSPAGSDSTGYDNVRVVTPMGESATSTSDQFVYGPTVSSITPSSGPVTGGTTVTVTGSGFDADGGVTTVEPDFGVAKASFTINSDSQMTVTMPPAYLGEPASTQLLLATAGVSGQYLQDDYVTSQFFTYTPVSPTVTSLSPDFGGIAGGTTVTVNGSGFFSGATTVSFGSAGAGTNVTVVSPTQLTVTSPPGSDSTGWVNLTVTTDSGTSAITTADQFVYCATVTGVSPSPVPHGTNETLTVTGTGFDSDGGVSGVEFSPGGSGTNVVVKSDTTLTVTTPRLTHGTAIIVVSNKGVTENGVAQVPSVGGVQQIQVS